MTNVATEEVVAPTSERLVAANDNYVLDPTTKAHRMQDAPIDRLYRDGRISKAQHAAAEQFFADYYAAGLAPLGAVDYGRPMVDGSKPSSVSDMRMGAQDRYNGAMKDLGRYKDVVDMVVLREQSVEGAGRVLGYRNSSQARAVGLDRLQGGLDILARRYGLGRG